MKVTCQWNICIEAKKIPLRGHLERSVCVCLCVLSLSLSLSLSPPFVYLCVCVLLATFFSWYSKEFILQHGLLNTHRNVLKGIFPPTLQFQAQQHLSHTHTKENLYSTFWIKNKKQESQNMPRLFETSWHWQNVEAVILKFVSKACNSPGQDFTEESNQQAICRSWYTCVCMWNFSFKSEFFLLINKRILPFCPGPLGPGQKGRILFL